VRTDDICRNHHGGNSESNAANEGTDKRRDSKRIVDALLNVGWRGLTCDELEVVLVMSHQTCSARCSELKRDGILAYKSYALDSTRYQKRPTRTGSQAGVLILANPQGALFQ
jgi:hypothetical protein